MASQPIPDATHGAWWRLPRVMAETGLSRSTIYRLKDRGEFPQNHAMRSVRAKVWLENEVRAWKHGEIDASASGLGDLL